MKPVPPPGSYPVSPSGRVVHTSVPTRHDSGQALVEFLVVVPALLLLIFGIIEMGAAWRTYQVVTNTAREGARLAVVPGAEETGVLDAIRERLARGGLNPDNAAVEILCDGGEGSACFGSGRSGTGTEVLLSYPYTFRLLAPLAQYMGGGGGNFGTVTMQTGILMRNE